MAVKTAMQNLEESVESILAGLVKNRLIKVQSKHLINLR